MLLECLLVSTGPVERAVSPCPRAGSRVLLVCLLVSTGPVERAVSPCPKRTRSYPVSGNPADQPRGTIPHSIVVKGSTKSVSPYTNLQMYLGLSSSTVQTLHICTLHNVCLWTVRIWSVQQVECTDMPLERCQSVDSPPLLGLGWHFYIAPDAASSCCLSS